MTTRGALVGLLLELLISTAEAHPPVWSFQMDRRTRIPQNDFITDYIDFFDSKVECEKARARIIKAYAPQNTVLWTSGTFVAHRWEAEPCLPLRENDPRWHWMGPHRDPPKFIPDGKRE